MLHAPEVHTSVKLPGNEPDQDLVMAVKNGDTDAFAILVSKYEKRICRVAYRITRNQEDAEDVTQMVFCKVFLRLDSFQGRSTFFTWLTRIAVNESLMQRRRKEGVLLSLDGPYDNDSRSEAIDVPARGPNPEQAHSFDEMQRFLSSALELLNRSLRVVFVMHLEGYSGKETAEALGLSIESVKTRLFRARAALRSQLDRFLSAKPVDKPTLVRRKSAKRRSSRATGPSFPTNGEEIAQQLPAANW
jgi:RNA polymerase sigma-70 factor, ECF subfamily